MPLRMAKYATFLLNMLETPSFWAWAIIRNHFQQPQTHQKVKNGMQGVQNHFKEVISNFESDDLLNVVLDPLNLILDLQVGLRLLKMVSNDCPCPKTWGFQHVQKKSYTFGHPERHDFSNIFEKGGGGHYVRIF